jgi:hypothetical protein
VENQVSWKNARTSLFGFCDLILKTAINLDKLTIKEYLKLVMNTVKAYEEVIDFIAAGTTPQNVIAFHPSQAAQERVEDLLQREKEGELSPAEKSELDHYLQLEHLMRLAKARARYFLTNE